MKLKGAPFPPQELLTVKLPRGDTFIEVKVSGFPLGVNRDYAKLWPRPIPPSTTFNAVGKPPEQIANLDDPAWMKEMADWRYHNNIYVVYRALLGSGEVTFDAKPDGREGIIALVAELHTSGLSEGDIGIILEGVRAASHIDDAKIQAEKRTF